MIILNVFRTLFRLVKTRLTMVYYVSDFPDGKLIGRPSQIGLFSVIDYGGNVTIGKNVKIGFGVVILSVSSITGSKKTEYIRKPILFGNNVEIGSNSCILPGVTIGDNSTVGAGAVVIENVPSNSVVVGIPAKIVKSKDYS